MMVTKSKVRQLPPEAANNAVLYLRVSSAGQVNTDYDPEGISIPAQREACLRKAQQLGLTVIQEYVEPGKTGTEMTKRVAFQAMLRRIKDERDVAYVVVHKLSRMNRNRLDDAFVMADLHSWGTTLVSATENIDDSPEGQLMHGMLASFNQYRSQSDGADIRYKMGEKAKRGGTINRAPLGYKNVRVEYEGRLINTVAVDEVRAPLIRIAWNLYATGEYSLDRLQTTMADQGLLTRASGRRPAQPVSLSKLHQMLHNPYYTGMVTYKGEIFPGRHEALVSQALFDRVQEVLALRSQPSHRDRIHSHYLKGMLFCDRCFKAGRTSRLIYTEVTGRTGQHYEYFVCRGRQEKYCDLPHLATWQIEQYIERHYATISLPMDFMTDVRRQITRTMEGEQETVRQVHASVKAQLAKLEAQEENLLDLVADDSIPREKVRARLRKIQLERERAQESLVDASEQLAQGADILRRYLDLLDNPERLYLRSPDDARTLLNQAFFDRFYVDEFAVADDVRTSAFQQMVALRQPEPGHEKGANLMVDASRETGIGLLGAIDLVDVSNKTILVELQGIEPWTSSMRTKRATNCATAPNPDLSANLRKNTSRPRPSRTPANGSGERPQAGRKDSPTSTGTPRETSRWAAIVISLP